VKDVDTLFAQVARQPNGTRNMSRTVQLDWKQCDVGWEVGLKFFGNRERTDQMRMKVLAIQPPEQRQNMFFRPTAYLRIREERQ
jgi:hypothetical protein